MQQGELGERTVKNPSGKGRGSRSQIRGWDVAKTLEGRGGGERGEKREEVQLGKYSWGGHSFWERGWYARRKSARSCSVKRRGGAELPRGLFEFACGSERIGQRETHIERA